MASRRPTNGRSPLVNPQRQITAFFSKKTSSPPKPNPSPKSDGSPSPGPSPGPATPSPIQQKPKKPLLVVGPSPNSTPDSATPKDSNGAEVVGRRIRVYWPLDKSWYEGCVKRFDEVSGKHLVLYDDAEEEMLNLSNERIEWLAEEKEQSLPPVKKFRRLRRLTVVEDEDEEDEENEGNGACEDDDSEDEDWGEKNAEKEVVEEDVLEDMDLDLEDDDDDIGAKRSKTSYKKRKVSGGLGKLLSFSSKKRKSNNDSTKQTNNVNNVCKVASMTDKKPSIAADTTRTAESEKGVDICKPPVDNFAERFGAREAEKLRFLGLARRDGKRRRPGDADYDPKTLYLPPDFLKGLPSGQRQWWEFKSKHMDKVLFFKMGKFYELFEMDAHVGAKELDLQYMKGEQPHCGFPEKNFSMNVEKLARKGYRVLVVEQTETPEQLELRRREEGSKDKVVKREICAVVTKGTLTEGEMLSANPDSSYLMAVMESCQNSENETGDRIFGVCAVDVATSRVLIGQFRDDSDCGVLCSLLSELRPVEIIKPAKLLSPDTERILFRHTRNPLINDLVPLSEFWDAEKAIHEVKCIYQRVNSQTASLSQNDAVSQTVSDGGDFLPSILAELVAAGEEGSYALSALGGTLFYLKNAFLDESLLRFAKFELLPCTGFGEIAQKPYMVLDSAAFENLEIFENSRNGDTEGTLYAQLNYCVTAFGKRLLKKWLARPLYHVESIQERQDAVAGLKGVNQPFVLEFRKELSRLPDIERLLARIFASSEAMGRNANKVILYEDAAKKQLQEFISALRGCEIISRACSTLASITETVDSKLLHHLLTPGKGLPEVHPILSEFKEGFDWVEAEKSGRIIPREGVDAEYDDACRSVGEVESSLMKHLKEQRKQLGDSSIKYVTIGKDSYLLEVPESLCESLPREYELQSSKKGYSRYWTPTIKKLMGELSLAESEKESKLKSILQRLVRKFSENHNMWGQLVATTAELDVLISISIASDYYEGPTCRPVFTGVSSPDAVPHLTAKSLGHAILRSDCLGKGAFVPNDVTLGGSGNAAFILLTGPNMGGKSTFLRQVCLAVILAQLGADVPAESFVMSPVDRIFVRMGARDHIMAGQSTFLTELSETASMLSLATRNSIVALDELGRGTSTSDGQAIAEAVLEHFVRKVQCRGLFSTHYHRLAINHERDPNVSLCHMACQVGKGTEGLEEVTFLYRLTPGACPKSYGVNVARIAGLPDVVLQKAASKSREFEEAYGKSNKRGSQDTFFSSPDWNKELKDVMSNLMKVDSSGSCSQDFMEGEDSPLIELQRKVKRVLLEQN
ncbi:OLC1v1004437C1 [Oldenlandia corymbosa var. corymbosa]|uniref:DNA mismatch repair protein n=1 Tax=Oldenlandia corymbosa var. corymbosa TaxID=529605 RepID=A0AAV1DCC4_OLDCO|nr:OLC1v1004437C1 [Oldenlandia corymbosa var. corymbosa]